MNADAYDVVLDDELHWSFMPRVDEKKAAAARGYQRFLDKWTEKGGIPPRSRPRDHLDADDDDDDDDDIGAHFVTTDRQLANTNRDIGRLLDNARQLVAGLPNPPDMATGHRMVLLDRARRVAMGEAQPPPMSLTNGLDGGVNRTIGRHRRARPQEPPRSGSGGRRRADMLPRRRADTGTRCVGVRANQFEKRAGVGRSTDRPRQRITPDKSDDITNTRPLRQNRAHHLQRVLAEYLLRMPAESAAQAAVRHL